MAKGKVAVVTADERILSANWAFLNQILEVPEGSSQGRTLVESRVRPIWLLW